MYCVSLKWGHKKHPPVTLQQCLSELNLCCIYKYLVLEITGPLLCRLKLKRSTDKNETFIWIEICFGWKRNSQFEITATSLSRVHVSPVKHKKRRPLDTHFVWPQWVRLLSHTTLELTLYPCYVRRHSVRPSRQACPFIPIRMAVNSWSRPWLGLNLIASHNGHSGQTDQ